MDEFLDWLMDLYACGEITDQEIEKGLIDDYFAYEMFIDSWTCDKTGTAMMAQEVFAKAKLRMDRKVKHGKPNS